MDVAQQLGFAAIAVEGGLTQPGAMAEGQLGQQLFKGAGGGFGQAQLQSGDGLFRLGVVIGQGADQSLEFRCRGQFIETDGQAGWIAIAPQATAQVEPCLEHTLLQGFSLGGAQGNGVESRSDFAGQTQFSQCGHQGPAPFQHRAGDGAQPLWAVVDGVKAGHDRQQHLGGADVAGGLVTTDVLLAGLQGQAQGRVAFGIAGLAHQASGDVALVVLAGGEESSMGAPEAHRHTEALQTANGDVGAQGAHRRQ